MQGQSSVNFFDIYNKKRNQGATGTPSGSSAVSGVTNNTPSYTNKYTRQMEDLDKDLMAEGLKIEKLSDDKKRDYVNSLSETEYQRLNQYRDAGYSFGASKALLDLERQRTSGVGGARSQGYQIAEPIGGQESALNKANFLGYLTEKLDNRLQEEIVPKLTVSEREKRSSKLRDKYKNMTDADWDKLYEDFVNDPKAKTYDEDSKDYTLKKYRIEKNTDRLDDLFSVGDQFKVTENTDGTAEVTPDLTPGGFQILANVPASALATTSAVIRGVTNPVDNLRMLTQLLATKEGRGLLADRYLSREGAAEAFEKDPIGRATDLFDVSSLLTKGASSTLRGAATAQRLAGYKDAATKTQNAANRLGQLSQDSNTVADLGISDTYDRILNKALARLSQGGKVSNAIGDYVSLTQQPLRTIWKGAGGINPQTGQPYNQTTGKWTFSGLEPALSKVWDSAKEKIQNQATGLTPEVRERIRQNPFIKEYRDRIEAMLNEQGAPLDNQKILEMPIEEVGKELLRRLDEYEASLEENGTEYQVLRQTTRPYNFTDFMAGVYEVFAKNGITITPEGELAFSTTANPADMNPVNIAWNVIKSMEPNLGSMTIAQILDFRKQLRSLINYESDSRATRFSKGIIRQIVDGQLNKLAHKEIPSLAKVDEVYNKQINELKEFKDGLVYQQGEKRGQIKDNFYSIISTINTQNRQKMKARLEKIFPDLGARVEAIRMLPILAKTYQNSPKLVNNMLKTLSALTGVRYAKGPIELALDWILGIIADELISKPLGEKWRKVEIRELLNEMSPEAQQKLAEIKSKIDAGVALSEQEKQDLALAMQEIAQKEYEYLDEKHKKELDKIMESANNQQPKLPGTMDTIGPDGTIKLSAGKQVNNPENYQPKTRDERIQEIQAEGDVTPEEAEEIANGVEDFLDEIGADIEGNITPGEVNYDRFSTRALEELMEDKTIPRVEKDKILEILVNREQESVLREATELDQEYSYKINKLMEEEQRIGKVGKNKVNREYAAKQMREWEKKKEKLIEQMSEDYGIDQFEAADKYAELEQKGSDYIKQYKKSKRYAQDQAELEAVDQLRQRWSEQPEFTLKLDQDTLNKRKEIISNELKNGYEWEETSVGDRFINKQTGDRGAISYGEDGTITAIFTEDGFRNSGVLEILPGDALVRFTGESETIPASEIRPESEYQTVGRANPNERDISVEEGMETENYKGNKTVRELADDYGLEVAIVDKIFTEAGEEALGRAKGNLIELVKEIKEGTAPHEVFHPIFNMVNKKRRAEIVDLVKKNKGMTEKEAKEWLADNFSEYFRTGKFDTKPIPKGFVNKVKWFFDKVKEFLNGTRKNRKKIQKLFDDIMDGKISVQKPEGGRWEYQIQQKSLFDADNPLNDYQMKDYSEINNAISDLYDIAHPIARDNNYAWDAFLRQLGNTYSSNMETWKEGLKAEGIKVSDQDLVRMYRGVLKTMNNPRNEFIFRASGYNPVMTGLSKLIDKIKIDPLDIPQEYGMMAEVIKQQDRSPLERYLEKHPGDIDELRKTYDPDVVEWRNNLASRGTNTEDLSLTRLYEIKNMLDEYIKTHPEDAEIEGTIDNTGIKFLVDKARYREKNNGEIGTYDKKQIKKVAEETEDLIKNRLDDLIRLIAIDPDYQGNVGRIEDNISIDFIGELANTYDPDVDKWQKSISKKIKELYEKTRDHVKISDKEINKLIKPHQLTGLKAKILELEKYSAEQIQDVYDGTFTEIFFRLVKSRIDKLKAKGAEKAVTNLVAIHNINENNLKKIIKDFEGKDPMPSIAVMDVNVPHEVFGDISLVFGRDTVDPKVNPENKMYASDAWTPTFPTLKYETIWNGIEEEEGRVRNLVATVQRSLDKGAASKDIQPEIIENIILDRIPNARKGEQIYIGDVAGRMVDVIRIIAKEEGKKMETEEYLRRYNELLDLLEPGMQEISKIPASYFSNGRKKSENVQKMAEEMASYIANDPAASSDILDFENEGELEDYIEKIINKRRGGGTEKIIDTLEMELGVNGDELREIVDKYFLPSGDQPTTPENILKAMKNQKLNRQTYPGEYEDMIEIEGTNLNDIEDVRRQNFAKVFHGDRTGDLGDLKKRYDRLVDIAARDIMGVDDYEAADTWKILKQEIKWNYDPKLETFKENLVEENSMWESVPDEVLQRIIDVVEQGKRIPIRFSESKPERIVNLMEEVQYILVPEGKQTDAVNEIVKGTPLEGKVQSYKPDNYSAPRSKKLKELQKKYGNVFFSMGGLTMPIAMLYLMMQQENEG